VKQPKEYFDLSIEELQSIAAWASDCAERSLSIYEGFESEDRRPRLAIDGARDFSANGKRTKQLRKLAMDAYRASLETVDAAASAAARSASLAAASAYTHPFKDANQGKHILGPAAYSALAIELSKGDDREIGKGEVERAIACAGGELARLAAKMPEQGAGKNRIDELFRDLDRGLRRRCFEGN
jgi:hypothetical protein